LRIEAYFQQLRETIDTCPIVRSFNVTYDKRGSHEGFIPTYPHHKHEGSEHNVVASSAPDLMTVLSEIETLVELP